MQIDRRQFMTAAMASTFAGTALLKAQPTTSKVDPLAVVPLGKSGLRVTRVGIGTGFRGGMRSSNQKRLGPEKFDAHINHAWDRGIRFFDCADHYGTHTDLARALKGKPRQDYVIVSKIWVRPGALPEKERPDANVVVDRFRKELSTDYIDLVQLHCMENPAWPQEWKRQMEILADLKARGIIKGHGVSVHSLGALQACATTPWVDVVHARANAYGNAMDAKPPVVAPVLKQIHDAGKGIIGMKLIGNGSFRNDPAKRLESIKYVLSLQTVDAMIVGFETPQEIDDWLKMLSQAMA